MPSHVIRDQLWESGRLELCSRDAALAYPWIFLVADDHGRFEFRPRRIWTKVFGLRKDITLDDVTGWLAEYEAQGLLIRYGKSGEFAYWYKFKGRSPSERRPSDLPDPSGFNRRAQKQDSRRDAVGETYPPPTKDVGVEVGGVGPLSDQSGSEQIGDGAENNPSTAVAVVSLDPVAQVFDHWREVMKHPHAMLTPKRKRNVLARLKEGYSVFQILEAIDGCRASPFNQGANATGTLYDDLELICRSGEKVEFYRAKLGAAPMALVRAGPRHDVKPTAGERTVEAVKAVIGRRAGGGG